MDEESRFPIPGIEPGIVKAEIDPNPEKGLGQKKEKQRAGRKFPCYTCGRKFSSDIGLKEHEKVKHPPKKVQKEKKSSKKIVNALNVSWPLVPKRAAHAKMFGKQCPRVWDVQNSMPTCQMLRVQCPRVGCTFTSVFMEEQQMHSQQHVIWESGHFHIARIQADIAEAALHLAAVEADIAQAALHLTAFQC